MPSSEATPSYSSIDGGAILRSWISSLESGKKVVGKFLYPRPMIYVVPDESVSGGRDAFKWEDVKDDQHRENYLGHSLMARTYLDAPILSPIFPSCSILK